MQALDSPEGRSSAHLVQNIRARGWMSFSDLLLVLVACPFSDSATGRFRTLNFNDIRTITTIAEINIHTSLHPRMTTNTLVLDTVAIAIQAFLRHRRRQQVDAADTLVVENTRIRLFYHFSREALVVVV